MPQVPYKQSLIAGMDLDTDQTRIKPEKSIYQKNLQIAINSNPDASDGEGNNYGALTPYEGNRANILPVGFPAGENICCGYYESKETNEGYFFNWNSNNSHFIYRVNGLDGSVQMVYKGSDLNFQLDPKYFICEGRCVLDVQHGNKYLIFTDNFNDIRLISVEDSIATDSFNTTTFPYFATGGGRCKHEYLINLGIAHYMQCMNITKVARTTPDKNKQNFLVNSMWQFRIKFIDVYLRESEHGVISEMITPIVGGGGCLSVSKSVSRCFDLKFDSGCALVDKIQIEFRRCFSNSNGTLTNTEWYLYDVLDKYDNSNPNNHYWQRGINPAITYNAGTNEITYRFCGDKKCEGLPREETDRFYNPLPLLSATCFKLDRGIGLGNNVRGFDPLRVSELNKVNFSVTGPSGGDCTTQAQKRTIVVYARIWNPYSLVDVGIRTKNGQTVFGEADCSNNNPISYDMVLANTEGWVGYLAGTPYATISQQVNYIPGMPWTQGTYAGPNPTNGFFLFQRFKFEVPPGKYIFRIGHHSATLNMDYAKTSTYVIGKSTWAAGAAAATEVKELVIDVCNGDHLSENGSDETLVIWDLTYTNNKTLINCLSNATTICDGYVREDQVNNIPVENAKVLTLTSSIIFTLAAVTKASCTKTDHNGFYFASGIAKRVSAYIMFTDCTRIHSLLNEDAIDNWNSQVGHKAHRDKYAYLGSDVYPDSGKRFLKGRVVLCDDATFGVSGALVNRAQGGWGYTDTDGFFSIQCHEWYDGTTTERLIYSQKGSCTITSCSDGCTQCFADAIAPYVPCTGGLRITTVADRAVNVKGLNKMGPQTGGRYGLGLIMHDWMGRPSFVQALDKHFVDIPSLLDTHIFDFSTINFDMTGIVFPNWVRWVTFCITENLNWSDSMMWSVDKVELIDGAGNVNTAAPTQIRIYYASLGEYNLKNNFATTTGWQFITNDNNQDISVAGDRLEFYLNGDGSWFDHSITAQVNYDTKGKFIVIDYTQELQNLSAGALFRMIRPKKCLTTNQYFEVCPVIKVNNGIPENYTGSIKYFDSYFLERQIPVPTFTYTPLPSGGQQENKTVQSFNYGYLYEHPSPSDTWGDHCHTKGRTLVKNPFERQNRVDTEIALSAASTIRGNFNGLSYFDPALAIEYDRQEWGPICIIIPEITMLLVICEKNNFIANYKDNRVYVLANDVVGGQNTFSKPDRKFGNNFGCMPQDINTIRKTDGLVIWLDRTKSALVFSTFADADDASAKGFKSYLQQKIKRQNELILAAAHGQKYYFVAGIDPKTSEYFLTAFSFTYDDRIFDGDILHRGGIVASFVNNQRDIFLDQNETISVDTKFGIPKSFVSFTPEYYCALESYFRKENIFTMKGATAYSHHNKPGEVPYNNFYGTQCKKMIRPVVNISPNKVKRYMYSEVYCKEHMMYIDPVTTESGQVSKVLPLHFDNREKFWCADYKCDLNTVFDPTTPANISANPLLDGNTLYGRWAAPLYISQDVDDPKYCEISSIVNYVIASEQSAD